MYRTRMAGISMAGAGPARPLTSTSPRQPCASGGRVSFISINTSDRLWTCSLGKLVSDGCMCICE